MSGPPKPRRTLFYLFLAGVLMLPLAAPCGAKPAEAVPSDGVHWVLSFVFEDFLDCAEVKGPARRHVGLRPVHPLLCGSPGLPGCESGEHVKAGDIVEIGGSARIAPMSASSGKGSLQ